MKTMEARYDVRVQREALGKSFHALWGEDKQYAAGLMKWIIAEKDPSSVRSWGYTGEWTALQAGFLARMKKYGVSHADASA